MIQRHLRLMCMNETYLYFSLTTQLIIIKSLTCPPVEMSAEEGEAQLAGTDAAPVVGGLFSPLPPLAALATAAAAADTAIEAGDARPNGFCAKGLTL